MLTKLILAGIASLLFAAEIAAQVPATPQKLNAILCQTEDQAIALAFSLGSGRTGAEVCGRYIGYAVVEIEKTENRNGGLYMLAGLRFAEDGRLGWTASWVAPFNSTGLARGT